MPSKNAKKWTIKDEMKLIQGLMKGKEIPEIATEINREESSIKGKIRRLIVDGIIEPDGGGGWRLPSDEVEDQIILNEINVRKVGDRVEVFGIHGKRKIQFFLDRLDVEIIVRAMMGEMEAGIRRTPSGAEYPDNRI